jgi:hypothetical protein
MASAFNKALSKCRIQPGDYVPELTAPEGPSTGGGVQAMQRLRLVPQQPGFPTFVVGSTNPKDGTAELRTFEYLDAQNRARFKKPLSLDRAEYDRFLELAKNFLTVLRLKVTLENTPSPQTLDAFVPMSVKEAGGGSKTPVALFLILGIAALFAVGVGLYFALAR